MGTENGVSGRPDDSRAAWSEHGLSRRRALAYAGAGAVAVWSAPAVLGTAVAGAAPSPPPPDGNGPGGTEDPEVIGEFEMPAEERAADPSGPEVLGSRVSASPGPTRLPVTGMEVLPMIAAGLGTIAGGTATVWAAHRLHDSAADLPEHEPGARS